MADIIGIARGNKPHLQDWEDLIRTIYFKCKIQNPKTKKAEISHLGVGVKRIQLYALTVPNELTNTLLGIILPKGLSHKQYESNKYYKILKKQLRKILKLKALPSSWKKQNIPITEIIHKLPVGFHPIGIMDDKIREDGTELL